jgi:hypothetical protein
MLGNRAFSRKLDAFGTKSQLAFETHIAIPYLVSPAGKLTICGTY